MVAAAIITSRLRLEALYPETIESLLAQDIANAQSIQGTVFCKEFLESADETFLYIQLEQLKSRPSSQEWGVRIIVRKEDGEVIGHCGFHGPPEIIGKTEIGYTILSGYRRQGYAVEAVRGLADWARLQGSAVVFASVSPGNSASIGVLKRLGFVITGVRDDEVDGQEYIYELAL